MTYQTFVPYVMIGPEASYIRCGFHTHLQSYQMNKK